MEPKLELATVSSGFRVYADYGLLQPIPCPLPAQDKRTHGTQCTTGSTFRIELEPRLRAVGSTQSASQRDNGIMPVGWEGDRQRIRSRAQRKMGMWALGSMFVVSITLYGSAVVHRKASFTLVHTRSTGTRWVREVRRWNSLCRLDRCFRLLC